MRENPDVSKNAEPVVTPLSSRSEGSIRMDAGSSSPLGRESHQPSRKEKKMTIKRITGIRNRCCFSIEIPHFLKNIGKCYIKTVL